MDASDLRIFEAVARLGSMSRASSELHTVQSNITARIRALEAELGVDLFHRTNKGVVATPAGKRLLPYTTLVAQILADARRAAMDDGTPTGPLAVGSLETTAAMRLSPVLARYTAAYPKVDLTLRTGTTCELVEQVIERQLDGALVCGPVNHPALVEEAMFEEDLVVLTAPAVNDLERYLATPSVTIIVLRAGCSYRLILEAALARRGVVGVRVLEFGTLESIFSTVAAGLGLTLLPTRLIDTVWSADRVAAHPLDPDLCRVETVFIRRHDTELPSALRAFLETARDAWRIEWLAAE